jgi:hypothetical protein
MISSWDTTKAKSNYHFDNFKNDPQVDKVIKLGRIIADYSEDVKHAVETAKPATWETRGYKGEGVLPPREDLIAEEYDLERAGVDPKSIITHMNWKLTPNLKKISELFGLADCMERIHVQMPGEAWTMHIDKLEKWAPNEPWRVMRIMIALNDWEPGHFWSYGNYNHQQWHAGDVTTFDWQNIPHCTANAGHVPRVTFQLTGVATEKTNEFINRLKRFDEHRLYDTVSSW